MGADVSGVVAGKPWFGPKRVGRGFRPTSWQRTLILLVLVAARPIPPHV